MLYSCLVISVASVASDEAEAEGAAAGGEGSTVEVVDEPIPEPFVEDILGPASGVETVVFFPNNPSKCKAFHSLYTCIHVRVVN